MSNDIQSMALEIAKVASKVSNVLNVQVTVDQVIQISQILNGEKVTGGSTKVKTKTVAKKDQVASNDVRIVWSDWVNWNKIIVDGSTHVFKYGEDLPIMAGIRINNLHNRFVQAAIKNAAAHGLKVRTKRIGYREVMISFYK